MWTLEDRCKSQLFVQIQGKCRINYIILILMTQCQLLNPIPIYGRASKENMLS